MLAHETLPPSPPESGSKRFMSQSHLLDCSQIPPQALQTPPAIEFSSDKHVEFQPWTTNIVDTFISTPEANNIHNLKPLPPSRECQITGPPILKPYQSADNILGYDGQQETSSASVTMISLLQHLALGERSSSIDAYQTMTNLIKVYDEPPEDIVLKTKMQQLQKCIQRDLVVLDHAPDDMPSEERLPLQNLIMSALKVLVTMVWSTNYSGYLSDDFRIWSIERTIKVLEQTTVPKACLLHYVHLLATQNFRSSILMSNGRALRVLEILDKLPQHVSGKAIISERLLVYQRLVDQARPVMQKSADLWARNIITAMAHSFKEIRLNAISVAAKVCTSFPASERIASATRAALSEVASERTLSASITNRLEKMIAAKEEASQIPQIWAAVLLMCSSNQTSIELWSSLPDWLRVIQRCFNCSDTSVRLHAFSAWNRFIHIVRPLTASDKMLSMLAKPIFAQLGRTALSHPGKGSRQAAISSLYMLFYYSFRPAATLKQYSHMWNELIVKNVSTAFVSKSSANCDVICRALAELFHHHSRGQKLWNEDRAHNNNAVEATELPMIDAKWIRAHTGAILDLFKLLVIYSSFGADDQISDKACVVQAWRSFLHAIRDTCMNEVVPTTDSKKAMNLVSVFLSTIYNDNRNGLTEEQAQARVDLLCIVTTGELGPATIFDRLSATSIADSPRLLLPAIMFFLQSQHSESPLHIQEIKLMQRLVTNLEEHLIEVQFQRNGLADLTSIIKGLTSALQNESQAFSLGLLRTLQRGIAKVIEHSNTPESLLLSNAVTQVLADADMTNLEPYDLILATVLKRGSTSAWVVFDTCRKRDQSNKQYSYGPLLLAQLEDIEQRPLLPPAQVAPTSTSPFDTTKVWDHSPATTTPKTANAEIKDKSLRTNAQSLRSTPQPPPAKVGLQAHIAPNCSFTTSPQSLKLRVLNENPRDTEERQQSEPAIAFSDVRSSPSKRKARLRLNDLEAERAEVTTNSPKTPTIDRTAEEREQPPTPTPRARNIRAQEIQPDVLSSPPSVADVNVVAEPHNVITSSPVNNQPHLEDAIQLGDVFGDDTFAHVPSAGFGADSVETPVFRVSTGSNGDSDARQSNANANLSAISQAKNAVDQAEQTHDSPLSTGDEFDAMAASQLSQDLEQLNYAESARKPSIEIGSTRKRKRNTSQRVAGRKKKRGQGRGEDASFTVTTAALDHLEETSNSLTASPTRKQARPETCPANEQDNITSGASREYRSIKERTLQGAGQKKKQLVKDHSQAVGLGQALALSPQQEHYDRFMHKLVSTGESAESVEVAANVLDNSEGDSLPQQPFVQPSSTESPEVAATPAMEQLQEDSPRAFDVQASLQAIMDKLNEVDRAHSIDVDLAAIHKLCFQIGLKTSELAQRQGYSP